jgi:hypothetical protein
MHKNKLKVNPNFSIAHPSHLLSQLLLFVQTPKLIIETNWVD